MGWWSTTIMGGDEPLDHLAMIRDIILEKTDITLNEDRERGFDGSLYPLEALADYPDEVGKLRQAFESSLDELMAMHRYGDEGILLQVIGSVAMALGADLPARVREQIIKASQDDESARGNAERKSHIDAFVEALKDHVPGKQWFEGTEGLFDRMAKMLEKTDLQ